MSGRYAETPGRASDAAVRASGYCARMAPGIVLLIIGAIFTFALKAESSWIDVRVLGVILMLGGIGFIVRAQVRRRTVTTHETEPSGEEEETTVVERRVE